jgi:hypothetical protein
MAALREEAPCGVDYHPFPVANVSAHQAGAGDDGFTQRDAAAGFDRIEIEFGDDWHGIAFLRGFLLLTSVRRRLMCRNHPGQA